MKRFIKPLAHLIGLFPLARIVYAYFTSITFQINPIAEATHLTGWWALNIFVASLAVTPFSTVTGSRILAPWRKILGLYAFLYAFLHFSVFVGLDYFFDWKQIGDAIVEKPYVLVGFAAFVIMLVLAATSPDVAKRWLKKKWKPLHKSVYAAGILVAFHYIWLVKSDIRLPLVYLGVMLILFVLRLPVVKTWFKDRRAASSTAS